MRVLVHTSVLIPALIKTPAHHARAAHVALLTGRIEKAR